VFFSVGSVVDTVDNINLHEGLKELHPSFIIENKITHLMFPHPYFSLQMAEQSKRHPIPLLRGAHTRSHKNKNKTKTISLVFSFLFFFQVIFFLFFVVLKLQNLWKKVVVFYLKETYQGSQDRFCLIERALCHNGQLCHLSILSLCRLLKSPTTLQK